MTDLRERFRAAEEIPAPDLWPSVQERIAEVSAERSDRPIRVLGPPVDHPSRRDAMRRALTIAAAFVIATIAIGSVIRAFRGSDKTPVDQPPGVFDQIHGWITYFDQSGLRAVDPSAPNDSVALAGVGEFPIAWSPDGNQLLLGDGRILNANGSEIQLVQVGDGLQGGSFSPNGSRVVYSTFAGDLFQIAADGGRPQLLMAGDGNTYLSSPAWSPDGSQIAFVAHTKSSDIDTISIMNADGTGRRVLLDLTGRRVGELGPLAWSQEGSRLAFSLNPTATNENRGLIYVVDSDGVHLRAITEDDGSWSPSWSPNGQQIAFVRGDRLFTVAPDGSELQEVLNTPGLFPRIAWNTGG